MRPGADISGKKAWGVGGVWAWCLGMVLRTCFLACVCVCSQSRSDFFVFVEQRSGAGRCDKDSWGGAGLRCDKDPQGFVS